VGVVKGRVSLVTLGVTDTDRAVAFYTALGWRLAGEADDGFRLFDTQGALLSLYPLESLRALAGNPPAASAGFRGVTLAVNLESVEDVDRAMAEVVAAGGEVLSEAHGFDWGGYSGMVADPDGHAWEIAFNPAWPIGADGRPVIDSEG
jgi:catechol 2,3-dioxygenase-like lactoylglutathione lyase family enzyme